MSEAEPMLPVAANRWLEALSWHERLTNENESELPTEVIRAWQAWNADPENQLVFDQVSALSAIRHSRCKSNRYRKGGLIVDDYDVTVPVAEWRIKSTAPPRRWSSIEKWRLPVKLAASAIVLLVIFIGWGPRISWNARSETFQTDVGRVENIHLSDGSAITMGGGTRLTVTLSSRVRFVQLTRGDAWFRVAHDPKWPFVVHAGDRVIRAVGTAFLVTRDSDRVIVTVTEGTVAITVPPPVPLSHTRSTALQRLQPSVRVTRGETISYSDDGALEPVVKADMSAAAGWTQGQLVFDDEPLRYVIESVNRYFPHRIAATPSAGSLRFSGVIFRSEVQDWLRGLSGIFPVDVDERGDVICVHMRAIQADQTCNSTH